MRMEKEKGSFIKGKDGSNLFLRVWDEVDKPKGVVQIFHGMAEHGGRYENFANFLNQRGYMVYANDHRGHGLSIGENSILAYLGEEGFYNIVEDERIISKIIREKHKGLPLYIFAHSFGSFIGQEYIIRYSKAIDGIILSGSAKQKGLDIRAGSILAGLQNTFLDNKKPAKLLDKLSFGSYNNKVENKRTKFDWLTRDKNEVDKYIGDNLSGYISPIDFYYNMFKGFKSLYLPERLKNIDKNLPVLILSGDMDPVGDYGKSVKGLLNQYEKLSLENVTLKLFKGGRHELLNEINKEEIYEYINRWLNNDRIPDTKVKGF